MVDNIGLLDVDSHNFPNLALMKISSFYKSKNKQVEWVRSNGIYDQVYKSKVFTFSKECDINFISEYVHQGGTGYDLQNKLTEDMETCFPDYSIYPQYDYAVGYLTRGCPRNCPFCIVGKKEGFVSRQVANVSDFYAGQKEIKLLDPNLIACKERIKLLHQLKLTGAKIDFTQGLDIRFVDEEITNILKKMKVSQFHFAYDRMNQSALIEKNLTKFVELTEFRRPHNSSVSVFILTNYETTLEEDLHRIYFCKRLGISPYVMIYEKEKLKRGKNIYNKLQRYVNWKPFFWGIETFDDYMQLQHKTTIKEFMEKQNG